MSHAVDQRSTSLWMDVDVAPDARPLYGDQRCDVLVVGSGMAGISTAYELAAKGQRVDRRRSRSYLWRHHRAHQRPSGAAM